jgi:hypothetical protein
VTVHSCQVCGFEFTDGTAEKARQAVVNAFHAKKKDTRK